MVDAKRAVEVLEEAVALADGYAVELGLVEAQKLAIAALKAQGEPFGYVVENGRDEFLYTLSGAQEHQQDYGGNITPLYTAQQTAMRPKRLEWRQICGGIDWVADLEADSEFGQFCVDAVDECWIYEGKEYSCLDQAKAAAQADYDRRALACFEPQPESHPAQAVPDGWQPIETAPKDGTVVNLYGEIYHLKGWERVSEGLLVRQGWFSHGIWQTGCFSRWENPTHWMPLPAAPAPGGDV